jgi:hypothetical protein
MSLVIRFLINRVKNEFLLFAIYLFHMDEVRKLIRETLSEVIVSEAARGFIDLDPNVGLVISKHTSDQLWINLFNFKLMKCQGIITLRKASSRAWMMTTVAADQGIGPVMYEIGMMSVYPAGVCLDRFGDTSADAFNVWKKFVDNRGDIQKIIIKPEDSEYFDRYADDEPKSYLENVICLRSKSIWFDKLIERGDRLMSQTSMKPQDVNDACRTYFIGRYSER